MVSQKEIFKYVRQVGRGCPFVYRKKLKSELKDNLYDFLKDNPGYTMEHVLNHFGTPQRFLDEYLLALEEKDRINVFHKTRHLRFAVYVGIAAIIFIIAIAAIWVVHENSRTAIYYYYEEVIE